ncbi:MAG: CoA-acylating methylmalonate-semialdehyde dehydrogenase [Betaproteobacteria bacterium]|nr:CoA-acylating methylmalonate-semialdehyde dehydrogenase [Betaproteobacteria bacterium]MDE2002310.1 CoA-acylating methylmalonate-semialdehyde dehydrogenase [Betaproteobacteria bacterium]MDE2209743.1 CoA-acylating methylmalonate-semialdehyde dehydrogenase [Betaproteobacteria bacterium]
MDLTTLERLPMWVGGHPHSPTTTRYGEVTNPATGEVVRHVPYGNAADVDAAVQSAAGAFPGWAASPPLRRARVLMRFRDLLDRHRKDLARIVTQEHGKTLADAEGSVVRGMEVVEFATGIPHLLKGEHNDSVGTDVDSWSMRMPLGVCAGITPFNFPAMVPMWMFPVAIACGNSFVLKPSERVPTLSLRLAELLQEAGLPDGVFNVVHGDKEAVDALLAHPMVRAVSFVGSTPIARYIYETSARHGKRVQALGGAKNHAIVMPDADLDFATEAIIGAGYGSAGERCMAISAIVAVGDVADALAAKLAQRARSVTTGPGDGADVEMGPVITCAARDRITGLIDRGVAEGASLLVDGRRPTIPGHADGFFVGPTLFDRVTPSMAIYREEIFGPVLAMLRVASLEDAIGLINANPYANGAALFTRSGHAARRFQRETEVGMAGINVPIPVPMAFYSFGGWRNSLFGDLNVHGVDGVRFYTRLKTVTSRWPDDGSAAPGFHMPLMG